MSNIPGIKKPSPAYSTLQQHNDDVGKEPHTPTTDGQRPPFRHRTLALTAAIFGYFLFAYDNTVIANIHPNIVEELGDIANLPLLSVSYNLSAFAANLLWGQLYRNFDGKWLFCVAVAVFEIGCEVCGAAPSMGALVGGRAIAGLGGGGIYLGTITFVTAMTSVAERPKWLALMGIGYAAGLIAGPLIGGAFASQATWRWSFYLLLPIGAILSPFYLLALPSLANPDPKPITTRLARIDYLGVFLFAAAVIGFDLFPALGGSEYSWSSPTVVGLGICFGGGVVAFIVQQYFCLLTTPSSRLFPGHLLLSWELCIQWAAMCMAMLSLYVPLYTLPLELQFVFGDSPLLSGVDLLPYIGTMAVALLVSGGLMRKHPYYMAYYLLGGVLIFVGGMLLHFATLKRGDSYLLGVSVLAFSVAQSKVTRSDDVPNATAFIGTAQMGGISMGLVASNSLFINLAANRLLSLFPDSPRQDVVNAVTGADSLLLKTLTPAVQAVALKRVESAVQDVYWLVVASGAALIVLALFMKRECCR